MSKKKPPPKTPGTTGPSRPSPNGSEADDTDWSPPEPPVFGEIFDYEAPGVPTPIDPAHDSLTKTKVPVRTPDPIQTLDERTFMEECAERINAFIVSYPNEAQHVLQSFVKYEHELVAIHNRFRRKKQATTGIPEDDDAEQLPPAGAPVAAIIAAVLQTHHGNGWYIRPVLLADPRNPGEHLIGYVEVVRQEDDPDRPPS